MNSKDTAKELLIGSYIFSAERIRSALRNTLIINTCRKHRDKPDDGDNIVGLCGQGGRHHYFRIPISALEWALDNIQRLKIDINRASLQKSVDELAFICQELRKRTDFDISTGCVNDSVPSIVPLIPPEEIWYKGRELPFDVWRLISFEFDLISAAISSQTEIRDVGFGSATQGALTFAYIINQAGTRRIHFDLKGISMPPNLSSQLDASRRMETSVARLFFEAGCLLTPLSDQAFSRWYPALRYLHWLDDGNAAFCVKDNFGNRSVDSRYKGLFAEEMAIGMMATVLSDRFGVIRINNTVEVLAPGAHRAGDPIADFVAQRISPGTSVTEWIIAESKGSLGSRVSKKRRERAKDQVQYTGRTLVNPHPIALTFCSKITFSNQSTITCCDIEDPEISLDTPHFEIDEDQAWRVAYAKAFRFVGLEMAARQVKQGEPVRSLQLADMPNNF